MKIIVVTGGAGFIGSNLIEQLLKNTKHNIISLDDYSCGSKKNHILSSRVKYIKGSTKNFQTIFNSLKKKIDTIFHFGEFSRIAQSFKLKKKCLDSNIVGSHAVISFCLENNIRIIYSATSAVLGNENAKNLSPYAFSKYTNLNLIINLNKWFGLKYEIVYFYNVFGRRQIKNKYMAAVVGIFESQYHKNKFLTVVRPGTQKRNFTNVLDVIDCCVFVYKKKLNRHYSIHNKKNISLLKLAKLFSCKIQFIKERPGERFKSRFVTCTRTVNIKMYFD